MIMVRRLSVIDIFLKESLCNRKGLVFFSYVYFSILKYPMDLPYHNAYHYNSEWPISSSTSEHFSMYPTQNSSTNCYNLSSCPPPPPHLPPAIPTCSSTYYDYYQSSNCCPSTTYSAPYPTYSSTSNQANSSQSNAE